MMEHNDLVEEQIPEELQPTPPAVRRVGIIGSPAPRRGLFELLLVATALGVELPSLPERPEPPTYGNSKPPSAPLPPRPTRDAINAAKAKGREKRGRR